jgi:hypothetical protein
MLDFSRSMRRIVSLDAETVTVQPGVVLGQLNRYLAAFGRQFGPDPATGGVTTMGSVLALDNSGSNWLRHGSARRHVIGMQVVMTDGEALEVGRHPVTDDPHRDPHPRRRDLVRRLAELIERERATIQAHQPKAWVNRCGYHLYDVLAEGELDLARLLIEEGTLALHWANEPSRSKTGLPLALTGNGGSRGGKRSHSAWRRRLDGLAILSLAREVMSAAPQFRARRRRCY